jgi:hypothetical protein
MLPDQGTRMIFSRWNRMPLMRAGDWCGRRPA